MIISILFFTFKPEQREVQTCTPPGSTIHLSSLCCVSHALEGICPPVSRSPLDLPPPEVQVTPLETGDPSHTACDIAPLVSAVGLYMLLLHPSEGLPNDTLDVLRLSGHRQTHEDMGLDLCKQGLDGIECGE